MAFPPFRSISRSASHGGLPRRPAETGLIRSASEPALFSPAGFVSPPWPLACGLEAADFASGTSAQSQFCIAPAHDPERANHPAYDEAADALDTWLRRWFQQPHRRAATDELAMQRHLCMLYILRPPMAGYLGRSLHKAEALTIREVFGCGPDTLRVLIRRLARHIGRNAGLGARGVPDQAGLALAARDFWAYVRECVERLDDFRDEAGRDRSGVTAEERAAIVRLHRAQLADEPVATRKIPAVDTRVSTSISAPSTVSPPPPSSSSSSSSSSCSSSVYFSARSSLDQATALARQASSQSSSLAAGSGRDSR